MALVNYNITCRNICNRAFHKKNRWVQAFNVLMLFIDSILISSLCIHCATFLNSFFFKTESYILIHCHL